MDDGFIVSADREYLERCRKEIETELSRFGMHLHPKKTVIYRLSDGIPILGFTFRLTATGKVVRIIDPKNVKHERKKLYRMAQLVKGGVMTRDKFNECYTSWKAHANLGDSYELLQRMDSYVKTLFMEVNYGESTE